MLSEDEIKLALHTDVAIPLGVANPHGPLGLEQLAEAVERLRTAVPGRSCVQRPIELPVETWQKLDELARRARQADPHGMTASGLAAAILEQAVNGQ